MEMEIAVMVRKASPLQGNLNVRFGILYSVLIHSLFIIFFFIKSHCSFFPTIIQPAIAVLVNPFHAFFLRIGIVKPHAILRNSASTLASVVSVQNVDMHDMERRRQIALKALSERLSRTTDSSRQKILPKSFPYHHHAHGHGYAHGHHGHNFSDSDQPSFIASSKGPVEFTIPAIPLPPPPGMQMQMQIAPANQSSSMATPQNSSAHVLIDLNNQNDQATNNSS